MAFELVRVGELLSAPLAALGRLVHPGGAVLGGTAETTHSRTAARTDVRASKSRSTALGRAGQESAERPTTTLEVPGW